MLKLSKHKKFLVFNKAIMDSYKIFIAFFEN